MREQEEEEGWIQGGKNNELWSLGDERNGAEKEEEEEKGRDGKEKEEEVTAQTRKG